MASRMRWLGASTDLSRGYDPIVTFLVFFERFFIVLYHRLWGLDVFDHHTEFQLWIHGDYHCEIQ